MTVKPDHWIARMARSARMIEPFAEEQIGRGVISFGVGSYGYDFRLDRQFNVFEPRGRELDPKRISESAFRKVEADSCLLPGGTFLLGKSIEYFRIPRTILTLCVGKSTYARCGVLVNVTPFEPEWEGFVTVSVSNTGSDPVRIYAGEGIAQLIFLESNEACRTSYGDKRGKYQAQRGIVLSKVEGTNDKVD